MSLKWNWHKIFSIILLTFGAITLFLAQSAYWINHTIFNQQSFSEITTTQILSDTSRDAISNAIVEKSLEDRPAVKRLVGDRAKALISGLLNSDLSSRAVSTISSKTYAYATSSDREDIKIDLATIKDSVAKVIDVSRRDTTQIESKVDQIPDEVVLVESSTFPDLSGFVKAMLWIGPLLWLSTLLLFGSYIYIGRAIYARRIYVTGIVISIVALFGLATIPFVPAPVSAALPTIELRPLGQNLAEGFLAPFSTQMWFMLGATLSFLLVFNQRFRILALIKSLGDKINKPPTTKKTTAKKTATKKKAKKK